MDSTFSPLQPVSPTLMGVILDNAPYGVVVTEAIRSAADGAIIDFRFRYYNSMALAITGLTPDDFQHTLSALNPSFREPGLFEQYVRLVEQGGAPVTSEQFFNDRYFSVTATRHEDGFISSFIDITQQKRSEQALQQANSTLLAVLNGAQAGIVSYRSVRNSDGQIIDFEFLSANQVACRLIGRSENQLIGQRILTLFPANREMGLFDRYVELAETGQPQHFETHYQADGLDSWFDVTGVRQQDGFVFTFLDISDRKRAEARAQESTNLLTTITNETQSGVALLEAVRDKQGQFQGFRFAMVNPACARLLSRKQAEIEGADFGAVFSPAESTDLLNQLRHVLDTGEPVRLPELAYHSDRVNGWFDLRVVKYRDGVIISFHDITAIKENQLAFSRQAEQLQAILDASISSILAMTAVRDESGRIIDFMMDKANRSVERSLFTTPDQLEGRTLLAVFPGNLDNGFFELYATATDTGVPQQGTLHYTDVNGFEGWFEVSAVQQSPDKVVITFMNVTESKQLERQLRESNASLNQFAYVASHDLQEPLRKIQSFSDILLTQYSAQIGPGTELLRRMQTAAGRMQTLIRDILVYSRLSNVGTLTWQPVDVGRLIGDVLVDLEMAVQEREAEIDIGTMPILSGDPAQLRQVFQNLLSNALKFTSPARKPYIRVLSERISRQQMPARVTVPGRPGRQYWQISVVDNGIGFNEEYAEKIFEAFERLHGRSSSYSGSGIGLAIVRRVMDNHQGAVTAHSREGEGATFSLYFPVADN
ncbi:hypothetical protein GCM10023187_46840 [Nibrella viscosa]|uniref:histidine kinase n=1 Tax=Nibrella viscosa TaxID=1084524 RepID=A0ABP8KTX4_9BACT